jgi:hypothetical protein
MTKEAQGKHPQDHGSYNLLLSMFYALKNKVLYAFSLHNTIIHQLTL